MSTLIVKTLVYMIVLFISGAVGRRRRRDGVHGAGRVEVGADGGAADEGGGAAVGLRAAAEGDRAEEAHGREPGAGTGEAEEEGEDHSFVIQCGWGLYFIYSDLIS